MPCHPALYIIVSTVKKEAKFGDKKKTNLIEKSWNSKTFFVPKRDKKRNKIRKFFSQQQQKKKIYLV